MSQTPGVVGHRFMTNPSNSLDPDLTAIAHEAEVEILTAETVEWAVRTGDMPVALSTAELGYYEAELRSLRDAATRLDEAEH
jgi:hypothetical protein